MNKRHYEHTLPNIRGSLSNTYQRANFVGLFGHDITQCVLVVNYQFDFIHIAVNFKLFFSFPLFGSFLCLNRLRFYGCGTRLSVQLHTTAFPANYSFAERKNLQEIHFKPPYQARQQTFASDKTQR
ncbi:hypothetical protein ACIXNR_20715 [Bacteroides fragilis]